MKITLCDIKGFGKLKNMRFSPGPGFNIIYEINEAGKSTLQAFFRAMLYGLRGGRRSKDGTLPPIKHYKPWIGDQFAGIMEYTLSNGESFRVGRNFEKGTVNIYDTNANSIGMNFPQDRDTGPRFAEEHLGVDETAFERSAFIRQLHAALDEEGRKGLIEKLSNLNAAGNEDISVTKALDALDDALLERVGTGRSTTRPLDIVNIKLSELEERRQSLEALNEEYLETARELHENKALLKSLENKLSQLSALRKDLLGDRLKSLYREIMDLEREASEADHRMTACESNIEKLKLFDGIAEDELSDAAILAESIKSSSEAIQAETERLKRLISDIQDLREVMESEEEFSQRVKSVEAALEADRNLNTHKKLKKNGVISIIAAAIILAAGAVLYGLTSSPVYPAIGLGVVIVLWIASALARTRQHHLPATQKLDDILADFGFESMSGFLEYKETRIKRQNFLEQHELKISEIRERISELQRKRLKSSEELCRILRSEVSEDDLSRKVRELRAGAESLKKARDELEILKLKRAGIGQQISLKLREAETLTGGSFESANELKAVVDLEKTAHDSASLNLQQLDGEISSLKESISAVRIKLASLEARMEKAPPEGELSAILEEISAYSDRKKSLEKTGSALTLAREVISGLALKRRKDHIPALNEGMGRIVSHLTSGRYSSVRTNDNSQIYLEAPETGELVPVSSLSAGTIDQVYLGMRIASLRLIEKERERLPLFFDEVFCQYDEGRLIKGFELLKELSAERQIFFFTSREREYEIARSVFGESLNRISL